MINLFEDDNDPDEFGMDASTRRRLKVDKLKSKVNKRKMKKPEKPMSTHIPYSLMFGEKMSLRKRSYLVEKVIYSKDDMIKFAKLFKPFLSTLVKQATKFNDGRNPGLSDIEWTKDILNMANAFGWSRDDIENDPRGLVREIVSFRR